MGRNKQTTIVFLCYWHNWPNEQHKMFQAVLGRWGEGELERDKTIEGNQRERQCVCLFFFTCRDLPCRHAPYTRVWRRQDDSKHTNTHMQWTVPSLTWLTGNKQHDETQHHLHRHQLTSLQNSSGQNAHTTNKHACTRTHTYFHPARAQQAQTNKSLYTQRSEESN